MEGFAYVGFVVLAPLLIALRKGGSKGGITLAVALLAASAVYVLL